MNDLLYIIDTFSLIFQVFHAITEMTGPNGQPTNAVFGFTRDLQLIRTQKKASHVICAFDSPGPGVRNDAYAAYKANRSEIPVDLAPQIPVIMQMVEAFGTPVISYPGWEADDVIATLVRQATEKGFEVRVVTNDKDVRQLLQPRVQIYNIRKNAYYDENSLKQEWGIRPDQVIDFQALVGDSVDNVPGVPLIGPKKAAALLAQFETLEKCLAGADTAQGGPKLRENLKTFADQARISRQLVELNTKLPITVDWEAARVKEPDRARLLSLFTELGFRRLAEEMRARTLVPDESAEAEPQRAARPLTEAAADAVRAIDESAVATGEIEQPPAPSSAAPPVFAPPPVSALEPAARRNYELVDTDEAFERFFHEFRQQKKYCVDLETTSLDAVQADIVGWAFSWQPRKGYYLPVRGPAGQRTLDPDRVLEKLKPLLENPDAEIVNQNIKYDMLVLRRVGVTLAGLGLDPMVGDYLLDAGARTHGLDALADKYLRHPMIPISELIGTGQKQLKMFEVDVAKAAEYAAEDAQVTFELADVVHDRLKAEGLAELYWNLERPLIAVLAEMEFAGIRVDVDELKRQSDELTHRLAALVSEIYAEAGTEFNIDSPIQLRRILFEQLKLPVLKRTKTGPSTDQDVLERLAPLHSLPARIIEHRQMQKLKGTYLDALPTMVNPETGRIHCSFNQVVAATGRLSSSDPNLQNIPIRTEEGRRVRRAFLASEGGQLLCADYSQIELRMLAHFSQDVALAAAFREGTDIHTAVAAEIFGLDESAVDSNMRRIAKAVNFGVIYGQSPFGLAAVLGIPQPEAARFIESYFAKYAGVDRYLTSILEECLATGYARTILGRRRRIEGIRADAIHDSGPFRQRNLAERTAINSVIQGSAADLIKQAMLNLSARLRREKSPAKMLLQIHDELVFDVPTKHVKQVAQIVREEMEHALKVDVPLVVDMSHGDNWLDLESL
jgi:DNA polymerase I